VRHRCGDVCDRAVRIDLRCSARAMKLIAIVAVLVFLGGLPCCVFRPSSKTGFDCLHQRA
jgi:hypothetical protein